MTARPYAPPSAVRDRLPLVVLAITVVVLLACLPLALALDDRVDSTRAVYTDRHEMAWLQHLNLLAGEQPVTGRVESGETVAVGPADDPATEEREDRPFTPSEGVWVEVRTEGAGYCVRAGDDEGHVTRWLCHDVDSPPERPTGDPLAQA